MPFFCVPKQFNRAHDFCVLPYLYLGQQTKGERIMIFWDTGTEEADEWLWTEKYKRDDIFLIQSCYNMKWSRDLNFLLSKIMPTLPLDLVYYDKGKNRVRKKKLSGSFEPAQRNQILYWYECVNSKAYKKADKVFILNSLTFNSVADRKEAYTIFHGSDFLEFNPSNNSAGKELERYIARSCKKVFVATDWFRDRLKDKSSENGNAIEAETIGLPILEPLQSPKTDNKILYNHRLNVDKNALYLLDFPDDLKKRIIISAPKRPMAGKDSYDQKLEKVFAPGKQIFYNDAKRVDKYREILSTSGFGVSFAKFDTFGYATVEGLISGLCYFVLRNDYTAAGDFMLDELMCDTMDEMYRKIRYYTEHLNERVELVIRQQERLKRYMPELWLNNLVNKI